MNPLPTAANANPYTQGISMIYKVIFSKKHNYLHPKVTAQKKARTLSDIWKRLFKYAKTLNVYA
jgi:hypothetical protein